MSTTAVNRPAQLRLTRRGRIVVVTLTLAAAFGLLAARGAPAASTDVVHHPQTRTVVVQPGETVWDIARAAQPGEDPRPLVSEIERLNGLVDAAALRVGEPLEVPVG